MKTNEENEKDFSRREFFKRVMKVALPAIASIALLSLPLPVEAKVCRGGTCLGTCDSTCKESCHGMCRGTCKAACQDNCSDYCKGGCKFSCSGTCKGSSK